MISAGLKPPSPHRSQIQRSSTSVYEIYNRAFEPCPPLVCEHRPGFCPQ
ncbi:hypothetical protein NIES2104_17310 [Leptolyngbya sp. NIES-2104]|nr:hypothetical protein NIES2104_17310 [Leptolyngbya sp. NIES-2104]